MQNVETHKDSNTRVAVHAPSLIVAGPAASVLGDLRRATHELSLGLIHRPVIEAPSGWEEAPNTLAILVDLDAPLATGLFMSLRKAPSWAHVPLIGFSQNPTEIVFAEAFWAGGDDVIGSQDVRQLVARLRLIRRSAPRAATPGRRRVLVAGSDPAFRMAAGRTLQGSGYDVVLVRSADEVESGVNDGCTELVVTSYELPGSTALDLLEKVRQAGCNVPFVISAAPRQMMHARLASRKAKNVAVCDAPGDVLPAATDLLHAPRSLRRPARRLSYGTRVWIRPAGGPQDVVAYTHDVSESGLFARTLYPFAAGEAAWIEITPPRCARRVRLLGQAVWHRSFEAGRPAGTDFRITEGLADELKIYEEGCRALSRSPQT